MNLPVTGGAWFIGSHLADTLLAKGHSVVIIDNLSTGKQKNLNPKARFYRMDIRSPRLLGVFQKEKPRIAFHFAAQADVRKSVRSPQEDADVNILGSLNVLEQCRKHRTQKVIFASTGGAIYGNPFQLPTPETFPPEPISPYGVAKLTVEHYLQSYLHLHGLSFAALRFGNVYGPRQDPTGEAGVVAIFAKAFTEIKRPVIYGSGRQTRDFVFVEDVVRSAFLAAKSRASGIFNIGTGKETSVRFLAEELSRIYGSGLKPRFAPLREGELERSFLDCRKAKRIFGWEPKVSLTEGLTRTVRWVDGRK